MAEYFVYVCPERKEFLNPCQIGGSIKFSEVVGNHGPAAVLPILMCSNTAHSVAGRWFGCRVGLCGDYSPVERDALLLPEADRDAFIAGGLNFYTATYRHSDELVGPAPDYLRDWVNITTDYMRYVTSREGSHDTFGLYDGMAPRDGEGHSAEGALWTRASIRGVLSDVLGNAMAIGASDTPDVQYGSREFWKVYEGEREIASRLIEFVRVALIPPEAMGPPPDDINAALEMIRGVIMSHDDPVGRVIAASVARRFMAAPRLRELYMFQEYWAPAPKAQKENER